MIQNEPNKSNKMHKFNVVCTFGDGPDVLVASNSLKILLLEHPNCQGFTHGVVGSWQLDLTVKEAEELSILLYEKAQIAKELYNELEEFC